MIDSPTARQRILVAILAALVLVLGVVAILLVGSPGTQKATPTSAPATSGPPSITQTIPGAKPTLPPTPTAGTAHVPASIKGDCSQDVSEPLMSWINSVPDNSVLTFTAGACYEIEGTLYIYNRNNLLFDGNGAKFWAKTDGKGARADPYLMKSNWPSRRSQWWIRQGSNITLRNMIVHGAANLSPEGVHAGPCCALKGQYGVIFAGVNGGALLNSTVTDAYSDTVSVTASDPGDNVHPQPCQNINILNNHLEHADRIGVSILDVTNVVVDHNYIGDVKLSTLDLEPEKKIWGIDRVWFTNNTVGPHAHFFITGGGTSAIDNDIDIENNVVKGGTIDMGFGSIVKPPQIRHNVRIANNRADTPSKMNRAIQIKAYDGVTITGNIAPVSKVAVSLSASSNVSVVNNSFPGASTIVANDGGSTYSQANNSS